MPIEARSCSASQGLNWFRQAWALFSGDAGSWFMLTLSYLLLSLVLGLVPMLGGLVLILINPALAAGLLHAAREQDQGRQIGPGLLFQAFRERERLQPLLLLGLLQLLLPLLLIPFSMLLVGSMPGMGHETGDPSVPEVSLAMLAGLLLTLALWLGVILLLLYAVPLVMFDTITPFEAIRSSFEAGIANLLPLTLLGLIFIPLWLFAVITFGLGFLLVIPLSLICIYTSYKDIFKPRFSLDARA